MSNDRIKSVLTDYKYIYKNRNGNTKTGFCFFFRMPDKNNKQQYIKASTNINKLVEYRDNYLKKNNLIL